MAKIKDGQSLKVEDTENVKHSPKDKMRYFAERSKVGAKDSNGNPLSDFARGQNFTKAEELGKKLGAYAKAKEEGNTVKMAEMQATRAEIKAQKERERADYKASKK